MRQKGVVAGGSKAVCPGRDIRVRTATIRRSVPTARRPDSPTSACERAPTLWRRPWWRSPLPAGGWSTGGESSRRLGCDHQGPAANIHKGSGCQRVPQTCLPGRAGNASENDEAVAFVGAWCRRVLGGVVESGGWIDP